jgi:antitoxin component YwqK of YwqJK toxin-antitoxin module
MKNFKFNNKKYGKYIIENVFTKILCCYYKNDKLVGKYIEYYKSDNILVNRFFNIQCYYKNGLLEGEYISYYINGNILVKCYYKNSKRECIIYYESGEIKEVLL